MYSAGAASHGGPPVPLTHSLSFPSMCDCVCVCQNANEQPPTSATPPSPHVPNPASNLFHFPIPHCSKWHFYILWWTNYSVLHSPLALRANLPRSAGGGGGAGGLLLLGRLDMANGKKPKTRREKKKKLMVPLSDISAGIDGGAGYWEVSKGDDGGRWRGHKAGMRGRCGNVERSVCGKVSVDKGGFNRMIKWWRRGKRVERRDKLQQG